MGYALAVTSEGAGARRHHGPARRRINVPTIRLSAKPVGSPVKVKVKNSANGSDFGVFSAFSDTMTAGLFVIGAAV